ncbi:hypothetical protein MRX96_017907 [Rhipicephalus microplus]
MHARRVSQPLVRTSTQHRVLYSQLHACMASMRSSVSLSRRKGSIRCREHRTSFSVVAADTGVQASALPPPSWSRKAILRTGASAASTQTNAVPACLGRE